MAKKLNKFGNDLAENKWENKYGSGSTKPRIVGGLSNAQANVRLDTQKGRKPTTSFTRYAAGEARAVRVNGKLVGFGAGAASQALNNLLKNAGSKTY